MTTDRLDRIERLTGRLEGQRAAIDFLIYMIGGDESMDRDDLPEYVANRLTKRQLAGVAVALADFLRHRNGITLEEVVHVSSYAAGRQDGMRDARDGLK